MTKSERKLKKVHQEFYDELYDAMVRAEPPLGMAHVVAQGLYFFIDLILQNSPTELAGRRIIKDIVNKAAMDLKDKS